LIGKKARTLSQTIAVHKRGPETFEVTVRDKSGETMHQVRMQVSDYERLCARKVSAERLIEASFGFLLDREDKSQILREFDIDVISRYFPEFERELQRYL
jgi:hypothetical protein